LEHADAGAGGGAEPGDGRAYLAGAWLETTPGEALQTLYGPTVHEKLQDVVGLYLDPPEKALVFSVDEKSQIQALDRTQPGLPMKKGRAGTADDYKRNGTTTLFAALNVATGEVIDDCMPRHRHDEFLPFLKKLEKQTDKALDLHIIADNYATHKHPDVNTWLATHPRIHMHFTPHPHPG